MAQKNKTNLTSSNSLAITDPLNKQNTAARVRGIIQDVIDSNLNTLDGGTVVGTLNTGTLSATTLNAGSIYNSYIETSGNPLFGTGPEGFIGIGTLGSSTGSYIGGAGDGTAGNKAKTYIANNVRLTNLPSPSDFVVVDPGQNSSAIYQKDGDLVFSNYTTIGGEVIKFCVSGGTFYSGNTDLYQIFAPFGGAGGTTTTVQPGSNITTGGTASSPIINLTDDIYVNRITASGSSTFATITATTFISGATNLYSIFGNLKGTLAATAGQIPYTTGVADTLTSSTGLTYSSSKFKTYDTGRFIQLGGWLTLESSYGAIYFHQTPTATNFAVVGNDTRTILNAPTSASQLDLQLGNSTKMQIISTKIISLLPAMFSSNVGDVPTARVDIHSGTTAQASLRIRSGQTVTTPNEGDVYNDGSHLVGKFGGVTRELSSNRVLSTQVAYGSTSGITSSSNLTYDGTTLVNWNKLAIGIGSTTSALHVVKTTEQIRAGYDVNKYVNLTVDTNSVATLDGSTGVRFDVRKTLSYKDLYSTSATPSIAAGLGAGSAPTISVVGTNDCGLISIAVGAGANSGADVVTITFSNAFAYPNGCFVVIAPADDATSLLTSEIDKIYCIGGTTTFIVQCNTAAPLNTGNTLKLNYHVKGF